MTDANGRVFLFLQGPDGPFFCRLARALKERGAQVRRVALDAADEDGWGRIGPLHRFREEAAFPTWLDAVLDADGITDLVLYDDTRPAHRMAIQRARARGLATHCLGDGYLRPGWITYERQGIGGDSRLMEIELSGMLAAAGTGTPPGGEARAIRDDPRQRLWRSVLDHARCLFPRRPLGREGARAVVRMLGTPWLRARRSVRQRLLVRSDMTIHLVLLQPPHDRSMRAHSGFSSRAEFIEAVIDAFAEGAWPEDCLVFKAHALDDGRGQPGRVIRDLARDLGLGGRVVFIDRGGKMGPLLDRARSVITVNAAEAQQALSRGMPVAALGRAVYRRPGLVSDQRLAAFIRQPDRPDMRIYRLFERFLKETSQVPGSFHARAGIERLTEHLSSKMLDPVDPYDRALGRVQAEAAPPCEASPPPCRAWSSPARNLAGGSDQGARAHGSRCLILPSRRSRRAV